MGLRLGAGGSGGDFDLDSARLGLMEGQQRDRPQSPPGVLGDSANEPKVESTDHITLPVVVLNAEGAVAKVDLEDVGPASQAGGEGELIQKRHHLAHGLLHRRVSELPPELEAEAATLLLRQRECVRPVGPAQDGHERLDEQAELGARSPERLPKPVPMGGTSRTRRRALLSREYPRRLQPHEVGSDGVAIDTRYLGKLGDLPRPLAQRLDDRETRGVSQEPMALRPFSEELDVGAVHGGIRLPADGAERRFDGARAHTTRRPARAAAMAGAAQGKFCPYSSFKPGLL